ncbi:hypothetical protein EPR50_G00043650 [Perca flavescens]|uniref:Uncharacterized protein n=1 Tax=Perca flavescens TaxID=8167 RepID=A0A484DJF9_PERFV|nr:hypothetical protein EPR50_G00043650 [Perca flavescens]
MGIGFLWTERSAAPLSQRHFCARQVGTVIHSAPEREETGIRELLRCIWRRRLISFPFLPPTSDFAKMKVGCIILACTLLVGTSSGSKAVQPLKPPCRPGFSQNFYTVIVSRDVLHGQSILKGKPAARWISFID